MSADPWRMPDDWHVRITHPAPVVPVAAPAVRWPREIMTAGLIAVLVALSGSVMGLIWSATAPKLSIRQAVAGSEQPYESLIAADGRFLIYGAIAGVVCATVVAVWRLEGPGVLVGLAVGGVLAALVADQVAIVAQHEGTVAALRGFGLHPTSDLIATVGLKVRATAVLLAWPIAAVAVTALVALVRDDHR